MADVVTALRLAADAADAARTVERAVSAAWSTLHVDRGAMGPAFAAWSRHERGHDRDIPTLGVALRRKHAAPADVAASLRATADQQDTTTTTGEPR